MPFVSTLVGEDENVVVIDGGVGEPLFSHNLKYTSGSPDAPLCVIVTRREYSKVPLYGKSANDSVVSTSRRLTIKGLLIESFAALLTVVQGICRDIVNLF